MTKKSTASLADLPRPSRAEWELLSIIAKLGTPSLAQILEEALGRDRVLDYYSSHKLLKRLADKGYLKAQKGEGRVQYVPLVDCAAALRLEAERFLGEVIGDHRAGLEVVGQVLAGRLRALEEEAEK